MTSSAQKMLCVAEDPDELKLGDKHRFLPETKILHLKYNPLKKGDSCWQPSFLGARLVLRNHNFFGSSSAFNCVNCGPS